ncbi:hypothetical protein [Flavobacterium davisii]|uniref:Uncharacterized protein n=1 Tax=Flavobacterium columnare TaxID=996 RepID=A0A8G0KU78_9FLAO|nr:hypothetical protein [Flavobacterium davisii]QYS89083.1 hypothetical protein JJC05_01180 [Flavobacterium davisii]
MKITLKINADSISAVNKLTHQIVYNSSPDKEVKLVQSICFDLAKKFQKAHQNSIENNNLFNSSKKQTINLKYHEAYALEKMIMLLIQSVNDDLARNSLNKIKDFINQKIA